MLQIDESLVSLPTRAQRLRGNRHFKHPISRVWWPRIPAAWIEHAITAPIRELRQQDGRIRCWIRVPEMENRYLRVILLKAGETVHNAFFDRRFTP
jgi:hypothetical protein